MSGTNRTLSFLLLIDFVLLFSSGLSAQVRLTDWETHSSMYESRDIDFDSQGRLWAVTAGGVYNYNFETDEYREFRNIDALLTLNTTAIACDTARKKIFIGTGEGYLEIVSENYEWSHDLSIKDYDTPNPTINDIKIIDDKVFIAGGFGMAIFNPVNDRFIETILKFGTFPSNTEIYYMEVFQGDLWVMTNNGLASISLDAPNFGPDNWNNYGPEVGVPDDLLGMNVAKGKLYIHDLKKISVLESDTFQIAYEDRIFGMGGGGNKLYFTAGWNFMELDQGGIPLEFDDIITDIQVVDRNDDLMVFLHFRDNGLGFYQGDTIRYLVPQTPAANQFVSMDVDSEGRLWTCSDGTKNSGLGFNYLEDDKWFNFDKVNYPDLENITTYYKIKAHDNGIISVSSWGHGVLLLENSSGNWIFDYIDQNDFPDLGNYPVIGASDIDRYGTIWFVVYGGDESGPLLLSLDSQGNWEEYDNYLGVNKRFYSQLEIDINGTKWLGSTNAMGLYYFNETNTPGNINDDKYGLFATYNSNILDMDQSALAVDKNGWLWIGTVSGMSVMINPSSVISGATTVIRKEISDLSSQKINDIVVDALNNKWIATNNGVWIFDQEGIYVDNITVSNSPLSSNEVLSLAHDPNTGRIFFGTKFGLSVAKSLSVKPDIVYDIKCYPQPYDPGKQDELIIEGLAADTDIRIVTIGGKLIRNIRAYGRTAVWDGRDERGDLVSSGVYLILASSETTDEDSVAKIAVIRK